LLTRPLDEGGNLVVRCGYDRSQGRYLESMAIDSRGLPTLAPALRSGRIRRLSMNGASPDTANLGRAFGLERTGNLLLLPILTPDGNPLAGLILLSPYSSKDWTPDEQESLNFLAKLLVHFLQRSEEMAGLKVDMSQVRQMARLSQDQAQEALDEKRKLQDQLAVAREDTDRDRSQLLTLTAAVATQTATQNTIDQLQTENEQLKEAVRWATEAASQQQQAAGGELRLALEEIALLNSMLGEGDQKIAEPREVQPELEPSTEQLDNIVSIAQDLRQPLSSIVGYSDFLLGESVGILGSQQRKYLDRIKVSTERMSRLVDDLLQATAIDPNITQLNLRDVDLSEVLNSVIADSSASMRRKKVTPHLEMPETPLQLTTDRRAFRKILNNLLQNAILTTPEGGEILFKVRLQTSEGNEDYVLVQMTDSGPGIASQDLLRVFSARTAEDHISGISGVDLLAVKTLVEALGGRMWVDSELGQGATFSVLLPVHPASETFPAEGDEIS
jgi:signal transduction histidine kinase